jgi:antitoxin HicB
MAELKEYLALRYTIILRRDAEGDFVAKVEELPGCSAHGKTSDEALENLDEAKALWIQDCLENADPVPLPNEDDALPSGKWLQRVPRKLHRKLQNLSRREGVSLNLFVTALLAEAVGERSENPKGRNRVHSEDVFVAAWSEQLQKENFDPPRAHWRVLDATSTGKHFGKLDISRGLAILSSRLPDKFELSSKAKKDAKKNHSSFEVC